MTDRYSSPITALPEGRAVMPRVDGVLGGRLFAWIGDVVVLAVLTMVVWFGLLVLGLFTFGATWLLIPIAAVPLMLAYAAITIGGRRQATLGMRMAGLRVERADGGRPDGLAAAVHALFFYVAAGTVALWVLDVLCGFARPDRRMGHDLLTGLVVVRS